MEKRELFLREVNEHLVVERGGELFPSPGVKLEEDGEELWKLRSPE